MRVLAAFSAGFSAGIFLAQFILPYDWLLPCAAVTFVLAWGRVVLRGNTGRRVFLIGLGLCLAFGYDWL